jgi:hypothetical protein
LDSEDFQIRKATLDDFANVRSCAQAAYSKYVDRIGKAPAPMDADFAAQIEQGIVHSSRPVLSRMRVQAEGVFNKSFGGFRGTLRPARCLITDLRATTYTKSG